MVEGAAGLVPPILAPAMHPQHPQRSLVRPSLLPPTLGSLNTQQAEQSHGGTQKGFFFPLKQVKDLKTPLGAWDGYH